MRTALLTLLGVNVVILQDLVSRFLNADPRTLIIRVLVAAGRAGGGVSGDEIIGFLEASFGVLQMKQGGGGGWNRRGLEHALEDLARYGLVERGAGIQGPAVDLARYAGRDLGRADYRRLCEARMTDREALVAADDATLLHLMGNDARKLTVLREAVRLWRAARPAGPPAPALPPYQQ